MTNQTPDFSDPEKAREYINGFSARVTPLRPIDRIRTQSREYHFDSLTDDEAVTVATLLYRDIEEPAHRNWSKQ